VLLKYQEVLEVNLMTSATSYSNFNPQVAKVVTVDAFHHHRADKPAADAIKQRWLQYSGMSPSYLEIL
jgi:thiamine biosynthesis lipoprotein ApbE